MSGAVSLYLPGAGLSTFTYRFERHDGVAGHAIFLAARQAQAPGQMFIVDSPLFGFTITFGPGTTYAQLVDFFNDYIFHNVTGTVGVQFAELSLPESDGPLAPRFVLSVIPVAVCSSTQAPQTLLGPGTGEPPLSEEF
jgi:hypothetical protein